MSKIYDVLSNSIQHVEVPFNYKRGNPLPLDNSTIWQALDIAKLYAADSLDTLKTLSAEYSMTSAQAETAIIFNNTSYDGQVIVAPNEAGELTQYMVKNGVLEPIGTQKWETLAALEAAAISSDTITVGTMAIAPNEKGDLTLFMVVADGETKAIKPVGTEVAADNKTLSVNADGVIGLVGATDDKLSSGTWEPKFKDGEFKWVDTTQTPDSNDLLDDIITLKSGLSNEISARKDADSFLSGVIDDVSSALTVHIETCEAADLFLSGAISAISSDLYKLSGEVSSISTDFDGRLDTLETDVSGLKEISAIHDNKITTISRTLSNLIGSAFKFCGSFVSLSAAEENRKNGDVVIVDNIEYVWVYDDDNLSGYFEQLGDNGDIITRDELTEALTEHTTTVNKAAKDAEDAKTAAEAAQVEAAAAKDAALSAAQEADELKTSFDNAVETAVTEAVAKATADAEDAKTAAEAAQAAAEAAKDTADELKTSFDNAVETAVTEAVAKATADAEDAKTAAQAAAQEAAELKTSFDNAVETAITEAVAEATTEASVAKDAALSAAQEAATAKTAAEAAQSEAQAAAKTASDIQTQVQTDLNTINGTIGDIQAELDEKLDGISGDIGAQITAISDNVVSVASALTEFIDTVESEYQEKISVENGLSINANTIGIDITALTSNTISADGIKLNVNIDQIKTDISLTSYALSNNVTTLVSSVSAETLTSANAYTGTQIDGISATISTTYLSTSEFSTYQTSANTRLTNIENNVSTLSNTTIPGLTAQIEQVSDIVNGLTNATRFIGVAAADAVITGNENTVIKLETGEHTIQDGDIVIFGNAEYIAVCAAHKNDDQQTCWYKWVQLGDESVCAETLDLVKELSGKFEAHVLSCEAADDFISAAIDTEVSARAAADEEIHTELSEHDSRIQEIEDTLSGILILNGGNAFGW